ncbi:MAG: 2-oxoacid:acceptor oxidoreductase subunit alpha [Pseudomonadales bacterium]|nr:2-oxoacid:acceptor oxidoreductase subunit alpha [Pseudomonadales bacterium]
MDIVAQDRRLLTGTHFMLGDHACAEGALAAGVSFFGGYPITPSTEVAERLAERLPEVGGHFVQMEDELGSIVCTVGASAAGARSMTATSGPGYSLMMEGIGLAVMMELPIVIANVQRASPSTGLPTKVGQSDYMQTRFGSHGDYGIVAYAPASPQECFDLTVRAFNVADRWRVPAVVLMDEVIGHMTERVEIPASVPFVDRKRPRGDGPHLPYRPDEDLVPPIAHAGDGHKVHMTGLTHDERGYPAPDAATHDALIRRLVDKVRRHADEIVEVEELHTEDADTLLIAAGCSARSAREAVRAARAEGRRVGLLRPISVWPFPSARLRELCATGRLERIVVVEVSLGQLAREVERIARRDIVSLGHAGGLLHHPRQILEALGDAP